MKTIKLSTQLLILFTTVTILSAVVFGLVTYRNYESIYLGVAKSELETYVDMIDTAPDVVDYYNQPFLGHIKVKIYDDIEEIFDDRLEISENLLEFETENAVFFDMVFEAYREGFEFVSKNEITYYLYLKKTKEITPNLSEYIVGVMHEKRVAELKRSTAQSDVLLSFIGTFTAFAVIIVAGNIILALWSREMTKRIRHLSTQVSTLGESGYQKEISVSGADEITELGDRVELMRIEIQQNEKTKQEMFQNLSHDFKTPIAVIKSYAEAIEDGITGVEDAKVIIEQSAKLEQKVMRLLEYNKLEYIDFTKPFEKVKMNSVISKVLEDYKILLSKFKLVIKLDDSVFYGFKENYITVVSNILDNATRYAKSKIVITLKNEKLTIFNDGIPIDEKYIENLFKPYEKGTKGQFGLGMSIVQKTVNRFGYRLSVQNIDDGVMFTIES